MGIAAEQDGAALPSQASGSEFRHQMGSFGFGKAEEQDTSGGQFLETMNRVSGTDSVRDPASLPERGGLNRTEMFGDAIQLEDRVIPQSPHRRQRHRERLHHRVLSVSGI